MKWFALVASFLQLSSCSHVSVKLPYASPASVTYINGIQGQENAVPYAGGSLQSAGLQYQAYHSPVAYQQNLQYSAPVQYQRYAPAVVPAKIEAHHVGYAAAQVPAVAAVPFVKHVPTVSNIPVTRFEAHQGFLEKQVDVAKPAVSTRKFEVRRPAIQKQFYDIEERVIIRPAGSALVELDEPTSKIQRGPAFLSESSPVPVQSSGFSSHLVAQAAAFSQSPSSPNAIPVIAHAPVHVTVAPVISNAPVSPSAISEASSASDEESVVVENAEFRNSKFESSKLESVENRGLFRSQQQLNEQQVASKGQESQLQEYLRSQQEQRFSSVISRSNGSPLHQTIARFPSQDVLPSSRASPEQSRTNQQKLIDLLTARGGITQIGFGRDGQASLIGDAGNVRARVLSATPSPDNVEPAGERVSTRRVVVTKPVETLQEIDVLEPATKFERVSVQQPTIFKTAHLDHVQVHGSVPVIGKAFAPAVAHAAVPVYQKSITPAYQYY